MYVVLLCKYSGVQLEEYCEAHKLTPDQAHSIVRQICCSLAAAEQVSCRIEMLIYKLRYNTSKI